ncbi:hypothetical protein ATANTOWER_025945 [Ataeniobius toweri]|uniref:BED-type domain-containing protein n=1 Tax=Ataeniobius toweri TaxID=208326 RepID=A0ABU7C0T0_9TELE|nr:hypothetical protein [Ataeniobius toweri]
MCLRMGTEFGTFVGTDRNPSVLQRTDSCKINWSHVSVPKHNIVTLREWTNGRSSMLDMNAALQAQERNQVSSRWYCRQSMAPLVKCDADYTRCNICDAKRKASGGNTSNLRKHLVKHQIFLKA